LIEIHRAVKNLASINVWYLEIYSKDTRDWDFARTQKVKPSKRQIVFTILVTLVGLKYK
jgi:hypothetical protein